MSLLVASSALAVMPPDVYRQAAKDAAYHVQVKVLKVVPPKSGPGECRVTGEVVSIFRDKARKLKLGRKISFNVSCKGDKDRVPPGGTIWKTRGALAKAKFIEAALNSDKTGKRFSVARWNTSIINARSKTPQWGFPFHPKKK